MTINEMVEAQLAKNPPRFEESKRNRGLHPALKAAPVLANLLDAYTTSQALKNRPDAREGNPAMAGVVENDLALYGVKGLIGVLMALGADELAKEGGLVKKPHRNMAKVMSTLTTALPLAAAVKNHGTAEEWW